MKNLNKLKIKYILIVICLLVILSIILPTLMRYYVSVTPNIVGYAKETRTSTYRIKFHNNGGEGTMEDMTINYNESQRLTRNTFTREEYNFGGWNTEEDGSGTQYTDEQEIICTTYINGNEINLYAQWNKNPIYTVEYNSNGGIGNMESQIFEVGVSQKLRPATFTKEDQVFWYWNTKADGTGTTYKDEEEVINLAEVNGATVTLYAIYAFEKYINNNDIVFDGTNYIDTGVYLFNEKNINRDFEVSFEIKERGSNVKLNTMMSAMDETASPWPGIVYRVHDANNDQYSANASSSSKVEKTYAAKNAQKVTFKRICGILYVQFNDGTNIEMVDLSLIKTPFEVPVIFGASLDANKNPFRYFKGTLSNLKIIIKDSRAGSIKFNKNGGTGTDFSQIIEPNTTVTLKKNTYTKVGYVLDSWNTNADGSGIRYENQETVTNIVNAGETLTLYAQWRKYAYSVQFEANGGVGNMEIQNFQSTVAQKLSASTFTKEGYSFVFWNTKTDGSGVSYEDEDLVNNLTTTEDGVVKLYAMYETYSYEYEGDIVFDGATYINTNIYLFSKKNANKDFEISFELKENNSTTAYTTILNSTDESGNPYPGFTFRVDKNKTQLEVEGNSIKAPEQTIKLPLDTVGRIEIKRVNGILYLKIDDGEEQQVIDYSTLKKFFYVPLGIGAGLTGTLKPQRYFTGTLSNIRVTLYE